MKQYIQKMVFICRYTHGQARGTLKTIQASLGLNPGFVEIVHI
jgi:hypothetical protein